ncbi:MAG: SIMPL domain-containing protein [Spirochaetaceae bacterium]|nr:SIMPL domain-containing protein [Myxococcales bacterium]MCB9725193.1 SIMPL domain-containing protein [Spirochaetaceae bacterium]
MKLASLFVVVLAGSLVGAPRAGAQIQVGETPRHRAAFQVEAVREIANDWVTARLSVVAEGQQPAAVAAAVNEAMARATTQAKRVADVDVRSGAYVTHPVYDDGRIVRWRAQQELRLESGNVDRLARLIGDLQSDAVLLSSIDFSVRRETREALEDELIEEALAAFRARAGLVAKGMGSKSWSLVELSVGGSHGAPPRVAMDYAETRMLSKAAAPAPVLEAGTSELRMQVSGTVELD